MNYRDCVQLHFIHNQAILYDPTYIEDAKIVMRIHTTQINKIYN